MRMSMIKQLGLTLIVLAAAIAGWAYYVPEARPWLARAGVLAFLDARGLVAEAPAEAAPGGPPGAGRAGGAGPGGVPVAAEPALERELKDRVTAIGSARGARSVEIQSEVAGQIVALLVEPGQFVQAGATLARLDTAAEVIAVDRAALIVDDARARLARATELQTRGAATDIQSQDAELALRTAELELRDAEFELQRRSVLAPFAGWVGILAVELGDRVEPGLLITWLEDRSSLIVDFRVPERVVSRLAVGDTLKATPLAAPGQHITGQITALDNRVDETSRSLLVQARIENPADALRAGMAFAIELEFSGQRYPAVDPLSIQWDAGGAFVWVVREGKAARQAVRIVQRNSDAVLVEGDLAPQDMVVTEGVQSLRPGMDVTLTPADGAEATVPTPVAERG